MWTKFFVFIIRLINSKIISNTETAQVTDVIKKVRHIRSYSIPSLFFVFIENLIQENCDLWRDRIKIISWNIYDKRKICEKLSAIININSTNY